MASRDMVVELGLVFKFTAAFFECAAECRLRHVIIKCINQLSQLLYFFKLTS